MRPPLPPFTEETATEKVRKAEDGWNSREPESVSLAYTVDTVWRNRNQFVRGRPEVVRFLTIKWQSESYPFLTRDTRNLKHLNEMVLVFV